EAALAEARARLEEAAAGAGRAGEAAAAELRARAEEADRRAREAEERAREAEERAREAEERARQALVDAGAEEELAARLRETQDRLALAERRLAERSAGPAGAEPGLAALEERVQAAEARARRAEELLEELHLALSTASLPPEAGELRERLARAGSTRHRHEAQEPEAAIRGAIAHELRSALARVLGSSLTLKAAVGTQEGQEALRHLNAATRRLDRLVQDLQDAPRLADGSLPLRRRRTDLEALVQRVVGEAEGLEQMVVELSTREAKATVDAARVEQILEAILETVRARGTPGSTIRVVLAPEEGGARISVEDAGPVPASLPGELALAARLAELHGGRLWVEERSGGGTAFRLSLPERAPEPGAAAAPQEGARPQTGRGSTA
ncbi:MAG TPA: ATP-binding protein, partial [Actinomycetota bacterium]|nr:ATP-binding protein [Actinomycetota bacterium]